MMTRTPPKTALAAFEPEQYVKVTAPRHSSFGRVAKVLEPRETATKVRFVDLPDWLTEDFSDPLGLEVELDNSVLSAIDLRKANVYLLIQLEEENGEHEYSRPVVVCATGRYEDKSPEEIAITIASEWYPDGEWSEERDAFVFPCDRELTVSIVGIQEISIPEYLAYRKVLSDHSPEPDCLESD